LLKTQRRALQFYRGQDLFGVEAVFCDLSGERFWRFESALYPDMVNEIHRHPLAGRIAKFRIEYMGLDELGVLVAEGYGLSYAEDGGLSVVEFTDVVLRGAEEDEAGINALLRDNLRRDLHIEGGEADLPAFASAGDDLAYEAVLPAEQDCCIGNVARLEHIADCGA
jgi:hypothetical protein